MKKILIAGVIILLLGCGERKVTMQGFPGLWTLIDADSLTGDRLRGLSQRIDLDEQWTFSEGVLKEYFDAQDTVWISNDTFYLNDLNHWLLLAPYRQTISLSNDSVLISGGNGIDISAFLDNTDAQTLSFSNPNLSISGGNSVDLSALSGGGSSYWTQSGSEIYYNSGNVGIFNTNPNAPIDIGNNTNSIVTDAAVVVRRDLEGSSESGHAFTDATIYSGPDGGINGYNSYDSHVKFTGDKYFDHYAHDQSRFVMEDTVKLDRAYGFWLLATQNSIDTLFENYGIYLDYIRGTGKVGKDVGLYIGPINRGYSENYAIQTKDGNIRFEQIRTSGDDDMLILARDTYGANEKMKIKWLVNNSEYGYVSNALNSGTDSYLSFATRNASLGERMRIDKDGKVIIYNGALDLKDNSIVSDDYNLRTEQGLSIENGSERIVLLYPPGGFLEGTGNPTTGAIEITFPSTAGTGDMIRGEVDVYVWDDNQSFRVIFAGYLTGLTWSKCQATVLAGDNTYMHTVRFGDDGTSPKIWIGETSTTWRFPEIHLKEIEASFSATYADWDGNFNVSIESSAFDNVDVTVDNPGLSVGDFLKLPALSAAPSSPSKGWVYMNNSDNHLYVYNGSTWVQLDN